MQSAYKSFGWALMVGAVLGVADVASGAVELLYRFSHAEWEATLKDGDGELQTYSWFAGERMGPGKLGQGSSSVEHVDNSTNMSPSGNVSAHGLGWTRVGITILSGGNGFTGSQYHQCIANTKIDIADPGAIATSRAEAESHFFFHVDTAGLIGVTPRVDASENGSVDFKLWKQTTYDPVSGTVALGEMVFDFYTVNNQSLFELPLEEGNYYLQIVTAANKTSDSPSAWQGGNAIAFGGFFVIEVPEPSTGLIGMGIAISAIARRRPRDYQKYQSPV